MGMEAQTNASTHPAPHKSGNACLGCRRRKLKCSRNAPCSNCAKADLPCIYNEQEPGLKRKRGPYKKDKNTRERHLEDVSRYLQSKATKDHHQTSAPEVSTSEQHGSASNSDAAVLLGDPGHEGSSPDDLVRDAVNAITCTTPAESGQQQSREPPPSREIPVEEPISHEHLNYCFHIFQQRIDPVTKIVHWPTFMQCFYSRGGMQSTSGQQEVLIHAICFAAISACSHDEILRNLNSTKDLHMSRHGYRIEAALVESTEMPQLEGLQALLLYMTTLRRSSEDTSRWMFPLALRLAQLIGLHRDPGESVLPLEAEIRRRLWWTLCNLESRSAEEGSMRNHSIMDRCSVSLPLNLNDEDLYPQLTQMPKPREGYSDVLLPRSRWEMAYSTYKIWQLRSQRMSDAEDDNNKRAKAQQQKILDEVNTRLQDRYFKHLDRTRRMDWLVLASIEVMIVKAQILIDHPHGAVKVCFAKPETRMIHLRRSVFIIERTTALQTDPRCAPFHWFYRNTVQWHALAIVITDLSRSNDASFFRTAWSALSPLLSIWNRLWQSRTHEPAWQHVNTLLSEAKERRLRQSMKEASQQQLPEEVNQCSGQLCGVEGQATHPAHHGDFNYEPKCNYPIDDNDYVSPISLDAALANFAPGSDDGLGFSDLSFAAAHTQDGDPFETFDPQAFEEVFGSIDWDNIDPLLESQAI